MEKRASELFVLGKRLAEKEAAAKPVPATDPKPVVKPPSDAAKAYQARFEGAAARATARDFTGAIAELEGAAASIQDADVKAEVEDDIALIKKAAVVLKESMDWLRQRPRGSGLSVAHRDGSGRSGSAPSLRSRERSAVRCGSPAGSPARRWPMRKTCGSRAT